MAKSMMILICFAASLAALATSVSADSEEEAQKVVLRDAKGIYKHEMAELQQDISLMEENFASLDANEKIIRVVAHQNFVLAYLKREQLVRGALGKFDAGRTGFREACGLVYNAHVAGLEQVTNYFQRMLEQLKGYEKAAAMISEPMTKSDERLTSRLREWRKACIAV